MCYATTECDQIQVTQKGHNQIKFLFILFDGPITLVNDLLEVTWSVRGHIYDELDYKVWMSNYTYQQTLLVYI